MRVEVPDVTSRAFKTLINFIYSDLNVDTVELDDDFVMQTLYAGFRDIDHDTLMMLLRRSELEPSSELVIFKAAQSWSEAECERRGLKVTPANKREVLGPALSLIRFPLMAVNEFGEAAQF
ncbi:unnamed protein product [Gongylonema pulchrum]|uniref:BACK domain-containing protein n=1 Tax=Gongylonema pulchrum TaxID=637853 RepID=A0A183EG81_9BILA|nr:unnamed protein product [Gongylonema pulchrum]